MPVVDVAREAEERGFESLFLPEHSHIPARQQIERPKGGDLPEDYRYIFDPFVALAMVASATCRLGLGTGICLAAQRDPIILAKTIATLDVMSGGRVILGVGAGWLTEEMENHGLDPRRRYQVLREHVQAMRAIWTSEVAEYHGDTVNFGPIWQWPKPFQRPHPPVLLGGTAPRMLDRVMTYADGWMPFAANGDDILARDIRAVQAKAVSDGGEPLSITVFGAAPDRAVLEQYREIGVRRCLLWLPPGPPEEVQRGLDSHAELLVKIRG
ncbi:putative F420-dependent oxidoreductase [Mycolicibacterium rhodesiae JS60]|nr:putative F420-dependent oxidoreductase [Mycolicibacterium rhodesiae JS60]